MKELIPLIEVTASSMSASYNSLQGQPYFKSKQTFMCSKSINCAVIRTHTRAKAQTVKEMPPNPEMLQISKHTQKGSADATMEISLQRRDIKDGKTYKKKNTWKEKNQSNQSK